MFVGGCGGFDGIRRKMAELQRKASYQKILRQLEYIAEDVLNDARSKGSYMDRNGNLRSSIGCRIYYNGKPIKSYKVQLVGNPTEPEKRQSLSELQSNFNEAMEQYASDNIAQIEGFTIALVAGMDYAYYVEAKGYNVLHESNILLQQRVKELIAKLNL